MPTGVVIGETAGFPDGDVYEGELEDGKPNGKGICRFASGCVYDGNWKDGQCHGSGIYRYKNGKVHEGEWKDNAPHGPGTMIFPNGDIFEGQWVGGKPHGKVKVSFRNGDVFEGDWVAGKECGVGKVTRKNGSVYKGETKDGKPHGEGTLKCEGGVRHEGQWVKGKRHGRGTLLFASGPIIEGRWTDGLIRNGKGTLKFSTGRSYEGEWTDGAFITTIEGEITTFDVRGTGYLCEDASPSLSKQMQQPTKAKRVYNHERQLRSQRSQQQRLQRNVAPKRCEHCGVDDGLYKLRVCSGCNLALYCSASCQKAARRSHQRICDIVSDLPARDADRLALKYDKEKMVDLDAGLRYATKYLDEMKHLAINLEKMAQKEDTDTVKLSSKYLSSLLRSKKGALDSVFCLPNADIQVAGITRNGHAVWKELHGLKQLRLSDMMFNDAQDICDIVRQQQDTLVVLCLPYLDIPWQKAKCRRTFAQIVSSCKHLVKLDLRGCVLTDSELKIMLQDLPSLRILSLKRHTNSNHEITDNTCRLIARKCPGLQELTLDNHNQLSVKGIRKIFEGCSNLRSFHTSTRKLSCADVRGLLDISPQLMCLSLNNGFDASHEEVSNVVEGVGGRTLLRFAGKAIWAPRKGSVIDWSMVSVETRKKYESQKAVWGRIEDRRTFMKVNEWGDDGTTK